jgi:hypothetical protein
MPPGNAAFGNLEPPIALKLAQLLLGVGSLLASQKVLV